MSTGFGPPLISNKARTTDKESPDQHHCDFCRLPVELRISILGHANSYEDLMALRSACACMYTASNSAESALTYEFLTRNYLSYNINIVRYAFAHHSLRAEARNRRNAEKLLQIHREYMQFEVSDLRKNKRFADIKYIQKYHMKILGSAFKYMLYPARSISVGRLLQISLSGRDKPSHYMWGSKIDLTDWFLTSYRERLRSTISRYCSSSDQIRQIGREFDAISAFTN